MFYSTLKILAEIILKNATDSNKLAFSLSKIYLMDKNKIYTAIAVVFGVAYAYNLFWLVKMLMGIGTYSYFRMAYLLQYIPVFLGIAGLIIFVASQFKRSNLFRVMMCLQIIAFPFLVMWYIFYFTKDADSIYQKLQLNWQAYVGMAMSLLVFISSVTGLRMLSINKTARLTVIEYGGERTAEFSPAKASLRFANRLIDVVLIFYTLFLNLSSFYLFFRRFIFLSESPKLIIFLEIPFLLLYYIILEGIFNTTAGKCATGTTISNASGERPNFGQIVVRSFCRLIPLEAFSFFSAGARGWHDSISETYVVQAVNKDDAYMDEIIFDAELNNPQP